MNTFVCTKVGLDPDELSALSKRGTLIWDIHDEVPPDAPIDRYLTSTRSAKRAFEDLGEVSVIPHHHCNMSGAPNVPEFGRGLVAGWIGAIKWLPQLNGTSYNTYLTDHMDFQEVVNAYRSIDIALNFRCETPVSKFHSQINPGIKIINCIGFGIPSVSANEPAYEEHGDGCTLFSTLDECEEKLEQLLKDKSLYESLRQNCIKKAGDFSIETICGKYIQLFENRFCSF
ncbi:glycosyltransferase [Pseudomonadota bacterium]